MAAIETSTQINMNNNVYTSSCKSEPINYTATKTRNKKSNFHLDVECKSRSESLDVIENYSPCSDSTAATSSSHMFVGTCSASRQGEESPVSVGEETNFDHFEDSLEMRNNATTDKLRTSKSCQTLSTIENNSMTRSISPVLSPHYRHSPTPPQTMRKKFQPGSVMRPVPSLRDTSPVNTTGVFEASSQQRSPEPQSDAPATHQWTGPSQAEWLGLVKKVNSLSALLHEQQLKTEFQHKQLVETEKKLYEERMARRVLENLLEQSNKRVSDSNSISSKHKQLPSWAAERQQQLQEMMKASGRSNPFANSKERPKPARRHSTIVGGGVRQNPYSTHPSGVPTSTGDYNKQVNATPAAQINRNELGSVSSCPPRIQGAHKRSSSLSQVSSSPMVYHFPKQVKPNCMEQKQTCVPQKGKGWRFCGGVTEEHDQASRGQLWRDLLVDGCGVDVQVADGSWVNAAVVRCSNVHKGDGSTAAMVLIHFVGQSSDEDRWYERTSMFISPHGTRVNRK